MSRRLEDPDNLGSAPTDDWVAPGVRSELAKVTFSHSAYLVYGGGGVAGLLLLFAVVALVAKLS